MDVYLTNPAPGVITVLTGTGVDTRPITPIELASLARLERTANEAEEATGTPAFFTLATRYHRLATEHRAIFGVDPLPATPEGVTL